MVRLLYCQLHPSRYIVDTIGFFVKPHFCWGIRNKTQGARQVGAWVVCFNTINPTCLAPAAL